MGDLRKIKIDFEDITLAIEDTSSCTNYLDTETGEVITVLAEINESNCFDEVFILSLPAWEKSMALEAQKIFNDENDRYIYITKIDTCEEYEFMCDFTDTLTDDNLRLGLMDALDGKGAFSKFRAIIKTSPELENSWYSFKEKQMRQYIIDFLNENGLEPAEKRIASK